jgi:hypothetical protein
MSAAARANKATMHELKLRRLLEHNHRLREELARPRVMVSIASVKWVVVSCKRTWETVSFGDQGMDGADGQLDQLLSRDEGPSRELLFFTRPARSRHRGAGDVATSIKRCA